jgi:serine/threonine protein kinase
MTESRNALTLGYTLHWYVIRQVLGQGGFGITYLAEDTNLNRKVAIKEYLPIEVAIRERDATVAPVTSACEEQYRWGLDRFLSEAQTLAHFSHPNIVRVIAVFPANNTAYMIMEYEQGEPLSDVLRRRKTLPAKELHDLAMPLLDGLEQVHAAGFIHRDIKPPNIYLRGNGSPVLLDFGSARQSFGMTTRTMTTMVSPGYAPFEQYTGKGERQGPWTDIYGLAATLYRAATGVSPPNAVDRSEALLNTGKDVLIPAAGLLPGGYQPAWLAALDHGLAFRAEERPQSIHAWRGELGWVAEAEIAVSAVADAATERVADLPTQKTSVITAATVKADMPKNSDAAARPATAKPQTRSWFRKPVAVVAVALIATFLLAGVIRHRIRSSFGVPAPETTETEEQESPVVSAVATNRPAISVPERQPAAAAPQPMPAASPSPETEKTPKLVPLLSGDDKQALAAIRRRLKQDPRDARASGELKKRLGGYLQQIQGAVKRGELEQAEAWVNEIRVLDPQNRGLERAVELIRKERLRGSPKAGE